MQKLFSWLDTHGLTVLAGFLLVFIPLFPKIPLLEAIPGYIVRVRIEDFLILTTVGFWFIQLLRKKVKVHPLMTKVIIAYAVIGLLSTLSALFITKTVPLESIHIMKTLLHYFRRLEYFSLFFVFFSAVKSMKEVKLFISIATAVVIAAALYGYGQKYLYWPVYSTMNREFSKGWRLVLTEHARVPSTFGGHYDAAAFTMMMITIMLALVWYVNNKWIRYSALLAFVAGFWLLILTASRTSFIAYLGAVSFLALVSVFVKGFLWPIPRYAAVIVFSLFVMLSFGDLSERFAQVFGLERIRNQFADTFLAAKIKRPENTKSMTEVEKEISQVTTPSDTPPTPVKDLPGDVYEDIPDIKPELDAEGKFTGEYKTVSRTYSDNAYKYGLSAAIRLDALWPRAIAGFKANPLLGSGYATLTKETVGQFTEAESTDNDYLRNLGETGILGAATYFGAIFLGVYLALKHLHKTQNTLSKAVFVGYVAGAVGLLLNAIYIDVFEASKVALTFWAMTGVVAAMTTFPEVTQAVKPAKKKYEK